ncbi:MAG: phosphate ABC transporter permease subunit PstC [Brevinema sp.]
MKKKSSSNYLTHHITFASTLLFIVFIVSLLISLIRCSFPSIQKFGFSFISGTAWNIKFLELHKVSLKDKALNLIFTVNLANHDRPILSFTHNDKPVSFNTKIENRTIMMTFEKPLTEGLYQLRLSPHLKDIYNKNIMDEITWSGELSNNRLIQQKIIGKKHGIFSKITQDENTRHFNILPFIIGTLASSLLALSISFPIAISIALFLTEYSHPKSKIAQLFAVLIDLLAGIPSVIYGLWGLALLVPRIGANLFTSALVLSVMIIPYTASLTREAISLVPNKLRQAGLGLGASHFQVIWKIVLPYAKSGIIAGILLTLGRALGETVAVTMVIGNRNQIPTSIFSPAQTISSLIANEYGEASGLKQSALIEAGLILIIITLLFSLLGRFIIRWSNKEHKIYEQGK